MKKQVIIASKSDEIMTAATALKLKNQFLEMGFSVRSTVIDLILQHYDKYSNSKGVVRLQNWWNGRVIDDSVNSDIEMVLNKLKYE